MPLLSSLLNWIMSLLQPLLESFMNTQIGQQLLTFLVQLLISLGKILPPEMINLIQNLLKLLGLG